MNSRGFSAACLIVALLSGCVIEAGNGSADAGIPRDASLYMDCEAKLRDVRAIGERMAAADRYRMLDEAIHDGCSIHQGVLEERFILSAVDGVGLPPAQLLAGFDWRRSKDSTFWWAFTSEVIDGNLPGIDAEEVLRRYQEAFALDFLPHLLKAQWHQSQDDFPAVERELAIATKMLGERQSDFFLMERMKLSAIYLLEGHTDVAYEMSRDFLRLHGEDAWEAPGKVAIAALSASRVGKTEEAQGLLRELLRRKPGASEDPVVKMAMAEIDL